LRFEFSVGACAITHNVPAVCGVAVLDR